MKAIAYKVRHPEKQHLVKVNAKKHELTFISNELNQDTLIYCLDKEAVILNAVDTLSPALMTELKAYGVKQIICFAEEPSDIISKQAEKYDILVNYVPHNDNEEYKAQQIINLLDQPSTSLLSNF